MAPLDPDTRISRADREEAIAQLRTSFAEGRMEPEELEQRLDEACRAVTVSELRSALRQLPAVRLPAEVEAAERARAEAEARELARQERSIGHRVGRAVRYWTLRFFVTMSAFLILIWAVTGGGYFWPIWPIAFFAFWIVLFWRPRRSQRGRRRP